MANILKPDLVWIEGRCYRVNEPTADLSVFQEHDMYENEMASNVLDDGEDEVCEVTVLDSGRYSTRLHVSQHFLGSVIGKKAAIKRKIESDTRTEIRIPKQGQDGDVVILGSSEASIKTARRRINAIVMATRLKQRPTHFISIPMNSPEIVASFNQFKEEILQEQCDRGLDGSMFIEGLKLHLTVCMLCLMDNEERRLASKLLTEAREAIILPALQSRPLQIVARGVSYMNDDPREVSVLYGNVEEAGQSGRLQALADDIAKYFNNSGFAKSEFDRETVKLHMTLINTKYGKTSEDEGQIKWNRKTHFDASRILEKYAQFEFGKQTVTDIHLSQRHAVGADGYYQPTCVVSCSNAGST